VELDTLRTFVQVMQLRSYAAVARLRNVDPSVVSRTVSALETELRVRLFQRTTRQLAPTEAALTYFERVEPLLGELDAAAALVGDRADSPRGTLRVTAPITFAQHNLMGLLPELAQRYPELAFDLILTDELVDLVSQRIDVAIRLGRLRESSLVAHRLCDLVYVAAASPAFLRAHRRIESPLDLERVPCLRYPVAGYPARWRFRRPGAGDDAVTEVSVRGPVTTANGEALRQCAVAGLGVALLPRWNLADALHRGALVPVLAEYQATVSEFDGAAWLLYPSRRYLPRKVRVFADLLREHFRDGAPAERALLAAQPERAERAERAGRAGRAGRKRAAPIAAAPSPAKARANPAKRNG
jgi:DNA-binding transcriptional LysR family regulator